MSPDIVIDVTFFTHAEGGRHSAIEGEFYACPLFIDGEGFDCRLLLGGRQLRLGLNYEVPVKFMNRDLVISKISIGTKIFLWEGRKIAEGTIKSIL
ncbi:hypothetical protein [Burkholderia alba]|uniref:hypothetical protein n=1 Tax=Burkholderia alba TaxID=2683677 RepID=UPI002B055298|nr:hypothetical protein [Burkholderia alba]